MWIRSLLVTPFVLVALGATPAPSAAADDITLSGCLVKGEGDREGYLLRNTSGDPAWEQSRDRKVAPNTVGATGDFQAIFYWLEDDDELRDHVGHRIELTGEFEGDVKDGEIEMERKDEWTELTVKSDGRRMKAVVPNSSILAGPGDDERKIHVLVRKVDVEKVRMLEPTCGKS
ncbi:MAG: hypothetical protein AB7Q29_08900 [Vicinamibacterales bacterium]